MKTFRAKFSKHTLLFAFASALLGLMALFLFVSAVAPTLWAQELATPPPPPPPKKYSYFAEWGNGGDGDGEFNAPRGIAFDVNDGWLYVADTGNGRIQKFDADGNYLAQWGGVKKPYGVAVAPDGTLYVTSMKNHRVIHFDANGNVLRQWGGSGSAHGKFKNPRGIAVDKNGKVYVADTGNRRIQKFDANGAFIKKWNVTSRENSGLSHPDGIAVDNKLRVYVSDSARHRIVQYSARGKFLQAWGTEGSANGEFKFPRLLAVDAFNQLYVADSENHRIQKFAANGNFMTKFGAPGVGDGELDRPYGVAVSPDENTVFVSDTENNRVQIWKARASLPDLKITRMSIGYQSGGACLVPGTPWGIRVWVKNDGGASAGAFKVDVNGTLVDVAGLATGAETSVFTTELAANEQRAFADANFEIAEGNENNNEREERVPIPTQPPPCTNTPTLLFTPTVTPTFTPSQTPTSMPGPPGLIEPEQNAVLPQPVAPNSWYFYWAARQGPCYSWLYVTGPGGRHFEVRVDYFASGKYEYDYQTNQYLPNDALEGWSWKTYVTCPAGGNSSVTRVFSVQPAPTHTATPTATTAP